MERGCSLIPIPSFDVNLFWQLKIYHMSLRKFVFLFAYLHFVFCYVRVNGQTPYMHIGPIKKKIHHRMIIDHKNDEEEDFHDNVNYTICQCFCAIRFKVHQYCSLFILYYQPQLNRTKMILQNVFTDSELKFHYFAEQC